MTNGDDSRSSVSFEPLIKDKEANRTVTPQFILFIPLFFDKKEYSQMFQVIDLFRRLNP